jgi:hypothetical protein
MQWPEDHDQYHRHEDWNEETDHHFIEKDADDDQDRE